MNLSNSVSLYIPILCVLPVSLRDCLYCEKDVGRVLCHGHISHLVHPKDRLEHAKKCLENLANTFFSHVILNFFSRVTSSTCGDKFHLTS